MSSLSKKVSYNWKDLFSSSNDKSKDFSLSYVPLASPEVSFLEDELKIGKKEWSYTLVGHAIGKRPLYGSLLAAVKRKWTFKGSFEFLTLEGTFSSSILCVKRTTAWSKITTLNFSTEGPFYFKSGIVISAPLKKMLKTFLYGLNYQKFCSIVGMRLYF